MAKVLQKLVIVSHVIHYRSGDQLFAYGPYAREIDIWADLFPRVLIAAPARHESPPKDCLAFTRNNISVFPLKETGGSSPKDKLLQLASLPSLIMALCRVMRTADAIHVRCPGNVGLLGTALAPFFSRCLVAKYAGQWSGYPGEPWTVRLQRALLRSWWWRGPVTVYGVWPNQPAKVIPFFTSILTAEQLKHALQVARTKRAGDPLRVLYVGRLSASKNVDTLLEVLALLKNRGSRFSCAVVGDGPERGKLEGQAAELHLDHDLRFAGAVSFERVLQFYEWADVLVLTSETEGWPKAIAEAMAFGVVCVGSARGFVPQMLGAGRGVIVPPRDLPALAAALHQIANDPEKFDSMRKSAAEWAQSYSLEGLQEALRDLLSTRWGVTLAAPRCRIEGIPEEARA